MEGGRETAEAATPCLTPGLDQTETFCPLVPRKWSLVLWSGMNSWAFKLRTGFLGRGLPCLSFFFFFFKLLLLPFFSVASVEAEEKGETRRHGNHILILPCFPHLAYLQLRDRRQDSHSPCCLAGCSSLSGTGFISLSAGELLWEYLWCVLELGLKDPDKNSFLQRTDRGGISHIETAKKGGTFSHIWWRSCLTGERGLCKQSAQIWKCRLPLVSPKQMVGSDTDGQNTLSRYRSTAEWISGLNFELWSMQGQSVKHRMGFLTFDPWLTGLIELSWFLLFSSTLLL